MIGQERYKEINELLNQKLEEKKVLIAAHRGSWSGNIVNNTIPAYLASLKMGADMFECDLAESTDGVMYCFHDGTERQNYGFNDNIKIFSSEEIDRLELLNENGHQSSYHAEKFEDVLNYFCHDELINIDRAGDILPSVAKILEKYPHAIKQAVIKTAVDEKCLEFFENYPVKFMYMGIANSLAEVKKILSYKNINVVGVEILAATEEDELFLDETIQWIREQGIFCWANAIKLNGRRKLFAELDDDMAIIKDPESTWGRMMDKGIEVIQTDWPGLLRDYRDSRNHK